MQGCLIIDKPEGVSSAHALNSLKKFVKPYKIGHAGTLDPFASGVLLVAIGQATRLLEYVVSEEKSYKFTIRWGIETDTIDNTGKTISTSDSFVRLSDLNDVILGFPKNSIIKQVPPKYSAIHINGRRAYDMARSGLDFEMEERDVFLRDLRILSHDNISTEFYLECGKGFYVRSLARDIAYRLGVCGHVSILRRTSIGKFTEHDAIKLAYLTELMHNHGERDTLLKFLHPPQAMLDDILVMHVGDQEEYALRKGQKVFASEFPASSCNRIAVYSKKYGDLIAVCNVYQCHLIPQKVFNSTI